MSSTAPTTLAPWLQRQLQALLAQRGHAWLLQGPSGLGQYELGLALTQAWLCEAPTATGACGVCGSCHLVDTRAHPDFVALMPETTALAFGWPLSEKAQKDIDDKKRTPSKEIRVEAMRDTVGFAQRTSARGRGMAVLVYPAERMNHVTANALLKTLEEPGKEVLMILTSARSHRLPVTIRSRCQLLRFTVPEQSQALSWLKASEQGSDASDEQVRQALSYASGSPLSALENLQTVEQQQLLAEAMTAAISGKPSLEYAAKFTKLQTLEGMLSWTSDLSRMIACGPDTEIINSQYRGKLQVLSKKVNQQRLFRFHDQLNFNIQHASIALNEQLLWENLLLSWDNL